MTALHQTGQTAHILLVDDEEAVIEIHRYRLEKLGYTVSDFISPLNALEDFTAHPDHYHAVITDFIMPEMDGTHLAQAIKAIRPEVPIILCTGDHSACEHNQLQERGIDQVLYKPVTQKSLADLLEYVISSNQ